MPTADEIKTAQAPLLEQVKTNTDPKAAMKMVLDEKDAQLGRIITDMLGAKGNPAMLQIAVDHAHAALEASDNDALIEAVMANTQKPEQPREVSASEPQTASEPAKTHPAEPHKTEEPTSRGKKPSGKD